MNWSTPVQVPQGANRIDYHSKVVVLGSCFASHLGQKLQYYQFRSLTNPFGVIFHPDPMKNLVQRALQSNPFLASELFQHQSLWRCFQTHSSLAQPGSEQALDLLNNTLKSFESALTEGSHVILTLGSAFGYTQKNTASIVANCHTVGGAAFNKVLSDPEALAGQLQALIEVIRQVNPGIQIVLTVSPVRHLKDGLIENQRSKAHLITAVHRVVDSGWANYFPAYELLLDELRDYRFYDSDLLHPSAVAVDYIWDHFKRAWIDPELSGVLHEVDSIQKGLLHRPLHPESEAHAVFVQNLHSRIAKLRSQYPFMAFGPADI